MVANSGKNYSKLLERRKRRNLKRKFFLFLRILAIVVFFAGLLWFFNYFYNSDYFKIKTITVTGNYKYKEEEIRSKADIAIGNNIFEINKKYIEDNLLNEFIWLKSIDLKKIFPDTISIEIVERKPFVKAVYGGKYYIVDSEGIVLDIMAGDDKENYKDIIAVKNALNYAPDTGEKIAKKAMLSCGDIYDALVSDMRKLMKEASLGNDGQGDIIFLTNDGKQIIFGTSDGLPDKVRILGPVLRKLKEDGVPYSVIDLRDIDNPLIK
jgi:cell division protein FtsQ